MTTIDDTVVKVAVRPVEALSTTLPLLSVVEMVKLEVGYKELGFSMLAIVITM